MNSNFSNNLFTTKQNPEIQSKISSNLFTTIQQNHNIIQSGLSSISYSWQQNPNINKSISWNLETNQNNQNRNKSIFHSNNSTQKNQYKFKSMFKEQEIVKDKIYIQPNQIESNQIYGQTKKQSFYTQPNNQQDQHTINYEQFSSHIIDSKFNYQITKESRKKKKQKIEYNKKILLQKVINNPQMYKNKKSSVEIKRKNIQQNKNIATNNQNEIQRQYIHRSFYKIQLPLQIIEQDLNQQQYKDQFQRTSDGRFRSKFSDSQKYFILHNFKILNQRIEKASQIYDMMTRMYWGSNIKIPPYNTLMRWRLEKL